MGIMTSIPTSLICGACGHLQKAHTVFHTHKIYKHSINLRYYNNMNDYLY